MLELNLTGLQNTGSSQNPPVDENKTDSTPVVAEQMEASVEEKPSKANFGLSLSSLMGKEETGVSAKETVSISTENNDPQEEISDQSSTIEDEIVETTEGTSILNLSDLSAKKEEEENRAHQKEEESKSILTAPEPVAEEKKEFFPKFNPLEEFNEEEILGLKKESGENNGESFSIFPLPESSSVVTEEIIPEVPSDVVSDKLIVSESTEQTVSEPEIQPITQSLPEQSVELGDTIKGEAATETAVVGSTEILKEKLSEERKTPGISKVFRKKIFIYSIGILCFCLLGIYGALNLTKVDKSDVLGKDNVIIKNENNVVVIKSIYQEGKDYTITKNTKKNIRKSKIEATEAGAGVNPMDSEEALPETSNVGADTSSSTSSGTTPAPLPPQ